MSGAGSSRAVVAGLCGAALFLYAFYLGSLGVLLPFVGAAFGLGPAAEGRLFPANFGGFIVGVLLCGILSDRMGRKPVLLGSVAAYALGLALFGVAPTFGLALAASALTGAGCGAMETVATALAADLYPERRAFLINLLQVAFGAGASLAPSLAHHLLTAGTSWRLLFLVLAAANVLLLLSLGLQAIPHVRHPEDAVDLAALRGLLRHPAFLALCLAQALYVGAEVGLTSWMPTYFLKRLPGGVPWAGLVVTVFWVAMTVGRITTGSLVGRLPLLRLALWLSLGGAAGAALTLWGHTPWAVMGSVAWAGLCFSGIFGLLLGEAAELYPRAAGTALGGLVAAAGVGGALVPWAMGEAVGTGLGWRAALALLPACMLALAATVRLLDGGAASPAQRV